MKSLCLVMKNLSLAMRNLLHNQVMKNLPRHHSPHMRNLLNMRNMKNMNILSQPMRSPRNCMVPLLLQATPHHLHHHLPHHTCHHQELQELEESKI